MRIGIDASRAFIKNRTGIEEYSYQTIKHLMDKLDRHRVILYVPKNQEIYFKLPHNWEIKIIKWPYLWTQVGLSLEVLFHPVDILFVPAHTVPIIHPKNTIVTIHGLEYEFCPKAYSFWERLYMRLVIKNSCKWANKIIAVSENTKNDLIKLYKVPEEKIEVIYEGTSEKLQIKNSKFQTNSKNQITNLKPYLLFIGRLEERKNIKGIAEAFDTLKEKYHISHKLVLIGKTGYGYDSIKLKIQSSKFRNEIIIKGFVNEEEKQKLLKNGDVFLFPSFYEGFGLPILEAQSTGTPVITSSVSSMPEVVDSSAILVDPNSPKDIAEAAYKLISDKNLRNNIINKGLENVKRFSWDKCSQEIKEMLTK